MKRSVWRSLPSLAIVLVTSLAVVGLPVAPASAFDAPQIEDLARAAQELHLPTVEVPHVVIPSAPVAGFGAATLTASQALTHDEAAFAAGAADTASKASDENTAAEDAIKKCLAAGLLELLDEIGRATEPVNAEEVIRSGMGPCFDKLAPENAQVALKLTDYYTKYASKEATGAYADSGNNAVVLGNWLRQTAAKVEETQEAQVDPPPKSSSDKISTAGIVVILIIVLGVGWGITHYRKREA